MEIKSSEIELLKHPNGEDVILGNGSFGIVRKAIWRKKCVAVKSFRDTDNDQREIEMLSRVSHQNIVEFYGVCWENELRRIIMEYVEGGSLHGFLHRMEEEYTVAQAIKWMLQCAEGVLYLHSMRPQPLIHRDLKPSNLLLDRNRDHLKICDFGVTRERSTIMTSAQGTVQYMAPEVFKSDNYTQQCDVFSFSIILWEVIARERPYNDKSNNFAIMYAVGICGDRPSDFASTDCPTPIKKLIFKCWHESDARRPTMKKVVKTMRKLSERYRRTNEQLESISPIYEVNEWLTTFSFL